MEYYENIPPTLELEANVDYVKQRTKAISHLVDVLFNFRKDVMKYGISPVKFHALYDHLTEELLGSETELQVLENDLAKERFLANE